MEILFAFAAGVSLPVLTGVWAMLWSGAYKILSTIIGLVVVRRTMSDGFVGRVMKQHLKVVWEGTGQGLFSMGFASIFRRSRLVFHRHDDSTFWRLYRHGRAPILLVETKDDHGVFYYLRGTVDWNKLMREVEDQHDVWYNAQDSRRFRIVRYYGGKDAKLEGTVEKGAVDKNTVDDASSVMFWKDEVSKHDPVGSRVEDLSLTSGLQAVVDEISFWYGSKGWYQERQIPWRRGYLLHGRPGTGKTSFVRAVAQQLDLPVYLLDLASMNNETFREAWEQARSAGASRIVVLEDFDAVFRGRENVNPKASLGFDAVLNAVDGIERQDGLLLFVTTNNPGSIDPALGVSGLDGRSTRPGRLDRAVEFGPLDLDGRSKVARRIVRDEALVTLLVEEGVSDTPAQFQERCYQRALDDVWRGRAATVHRRGGCMGTYGDDAQVTCDVCLRYLELVRECKGAA